MKKGTSTRLIPSLIFLYILYHKLRWNAKIVEAYKNLPRKHYCVIDNKKGTQPLCALNVILLMELEQLWDLELCYKVLDTQFDILIRVNPVWYS